MMEKNNTAYWCTQAFILEKKEGSLMVPWMIYGSRFLKTFLGGIFHALLIKEKKKNRLTPVDMTSPEFLIFFACYQCQSNQFATSYYSYLKTESHFFNY